jgi:phosphatidylglycerol:prolipoprotein diacylglycerol transferase
MILIGGVITTPGVWWDVRNRGLAAGARASFLVDFYLLLIAGAFLGGRILHVLTVPATYIEDPSQLWSLGNTGFVFFGSLVAIAIGWMWLARRYSIPIAVVFDIGATWMGLGHAIGRLGCFLAGCCWGAPTDAMFGLGFPPTSVVYAHGGAPFAGHGTVPLHPTQLYEAALLLAIFATLAGIRIFVGVDRPGVQAFRYALLYGVVRAVIEIFRGDASRGWLVQWTAPALAERLALPPDHPLGVSIAQGISLALALVGLGGLAYTRRRGRSPVNAQQRPQPS